ncbi:MAG TPA: hypothetical protein VGB63_16320 [Pedobacter sp.]|jgi:type II secretory pathway component PulJ
MKSLARLPAFTIIEVTVSMLLATISIVIAYTSYRVIGSSYREFDRKNKNMSEFVMTDKVLKKDIFNCGKLTRTPDGLSLSFSGGIIQYHFYPDYILRNQYNLRTDTLFVRSSELVALFEHQIVSSGAAADQVSFKAELNHRTIPLGYSKTYSAAELFK